MVFDPKRHYKSWIKQHRNYLNSFLQNRDEVKYIQNHENDKQDYWFEIIELQNNMFEYSNLLSSVSISLRRRLLLNIAATGLSRAKLVHLCGISNPRVLAYIRNESRLSNYSVELVSSLAIICRVPLLWLENEKIDNRWTTEHFHYVSLHKWSWDELIVYLNEKVLKHTVRGVIVEDKDGLHYLRIEKNKTNVIVELFNRSYTGSCLLTYSSVFKDNGFNTGNAHTVISSQVNLIFYKGYETVPFPYLQFDK